MAKIAKRRIRWVSSDSPDVVSHKVYWTIGGGTIDYTTSTVKTFPVSKLQAIIPDDIPELSDIDDVVNVGVSAVDSIGNESDITTSVVTFDFKAPNAPTGLSIESFF